VNNSKTYSKDVDQKRSPLQTIKLLLMLVKGHYAFAGFRGLAKLLRALPIRPHSLGGNVFSSTGKHRFECPCCGWTGARFLPHISTSYCIFGHVCPRCLAHPRHRSHRLIYENTLQFPRKSGSLLYISPEPSNLPFLKSCPQLKIETSNYQASPEDYYFGNTDHELNLMKIPLENDRFTYIVCHHVIEHVPNDRTAMLELFRILKPGGTLIMSVPLSNREDTIEYGKPNRLEENHYYRFGQDFAHRIPREFNVTPWRVQEEVDAQTMKKYGLKPDVIFLCTKP
jgi:hypothetical protein